MNILERLEDRRRDWQSTCALSINEYARNLVARLSGLLPDPVGPLSADQSAQLAAINEAIRVWAAKHLLPHCLAWLRESKQWPDSLAKDDIVYLELTAALQYLPFFQPYPPEPSSRLPVWSPALAAACGAALGMLLLTPLTVLLLGQREIGLFTGGVLGSAAPVMLVGILAAAVRVQAALSFALWASAAGSFAGGVLSYWRRRSTGWLRGSLGLLATRFVVFLARPQIAWPDREQYLRCIHQQLSPYLCHVADLVLAWCWAHPARLPAAPEGEVGATPYPAPFPMS
jgi:hypothetical protein